MRKFRTITKEHLLFIFSFKLAKPIILVIALLVETNMLKWSNTQLQCVTKNILSSCLGIHSNHEEYLQMNYNRTLRRLSALNITDTELKLIAKAAIMGDKRIPKKGNSTPAAIGTPSVL